MEDNQKDFNLNTTLEKTIKNLFRHFLTTSLIVFCLCNSSFSQSLNYATPSPYSVQLTPLLSNSAIKQDYKNTFVSNYHSYLGLFNDVNFINGIYLSNLNDRRALGASFLHESTSDFFTRTRFHMIYQEHVRINADTWLSMGAKVGFINFKMDALGGTAGGSAWSPDYGLGISLKNKDYGLGVSLEQLAQPKLQPIEYVFYLKRWLEVHVNYNILFSKEVKYIPEIRFRVQDGTNAIRWNNTIVYQDMAGVSFNVINQSGYAFSAFYINKSKVKNAFKLYLTYFTPTGDLENIDAEKIEFGAVFYFGKR